ncbi:helix-turn-helix domain-containing protein [Vibrio sp. Sgm 22]|uniref:helix-turn-helix domain-containing protein n=1 Tax=unclassified Vibrio TaxID=2614977 RepID=UPI0022488B40|nr:MULTISPECIES: helix-turn-helix domain-containing protein [unclassified Vibrio]MCX2758265.1 helix-turn-helix domain-containing protein [Vibrio sp. 14G-20]MCX2775375.1 helix-turn-helix domain-containing protein [Vibrio sp. Sgm 22]
MCVSLILSFIPMKTGSPISKLVLLKLADNADARGVCFPSLNYLAQYCEVSVRTVKRHVNELEKQGFVKRIKRFDDSGRQRSNIYQLRLPNGHHIQQSDLYETARYLDKADRDLDKTDRCLDKIDRSLDITDKDKVNRGQTNKTKSDLEEADLNNARAEQTSSLPASPVHAQKTEHSDTRLGDSRSNTESDRSAHIIFHKEHKTDIPCEEPSHDKDKESATSQTGSAKHGCLKSEAVIELLTKEGNAPIYREFYDILKRTYPKLDVLQELHAMQAWLYINPDKRKPFEYIGHFVNGWLRRSAKAKAKRYSLPAFERTSPAKHAKEPKQVKALKQTGANKSTQAAKSTTKPKQTLEFEKTIPAAEPTASQPTPVTQALAEFQANSKTNPFEARIKALIQSKPPGTDSEK